MSRRAVSFFALLLVAGFVRPDTVRAQSAETITEWNQALVTTLSTPGAADPNVFFTRPIAVLNLSMFDAVNSFSRTYTPYVRFVDVPADASADAAAAQAGHDAMVAMFPTQRAVYDGLLATQLSRVSGGPAQRGATVGATAARAILDLRADDGWNRPQPPFILPSLPGYWQPVPPQNTPAGFANYQDVAPFVIGSRNQFMPGPPPALTSALYAADFNRTKEIGSATSTTRTADQTLVARLFAAVGTTKASKCFSAAAPALTSTAHSRTPSCRPNTTSISLNSIRYPRTFTCVSARPRNSRFPSGRYRARSPLRYSRAPAAPLNGSGMKRSAVNSGRCQ